jgi:hypothetical protein
MKSVIPRRIRQAGGPVAAALVLALGTGCGPLQPDQSAPPPAEVKGEAIDSPVARAEDSQPTSSVQTTTNEPTSVAGFSEATPPAAPAAAAKPAAAKPAEPVAQTQDGFLQVGFDKLASFNYEVPDGPVTAEAGSNGDGEAAPPNKEQIPPEIKAFNRKRIALQGFMLPLKVENGLITELLIMRDQSMCCYGTVPKINEWVSVKMTGKGVKPIMDQAITMFGTLKVGEILENGYLVGIYEMDGERMAGPLDL